MDAAPSQSLWNWQIILPMSGHVGVDVLGQYK